MMQLMRPVIDFLNKLKEEKQSKEDADDVGPLEKLVERAKPIAIQEVETRPVFLVPVIRAARSPEGPAMQRIQYDAPYEKVVKAMRVMRVTSYKSLGVGTFDYFYNAEVDS
jgi:hypothetical protein